MLTPNGFTKLLTGLMSSIELTEEIENMIAQIQNDFEERNAIIEKYGNEYDSELDEYEFSEKEIEQPQVDDYKEKYLELKERYINRFMGKEPTGDEPTGDEPTGDEPTGDETTIDDLFEIKED